MFRAFDRRLQLEVQSIVDSRLSKFSTGVPVTVSKHPRQRFAVWVGGSLLSTSNLFTRNCHTKQEYQEVGASVCRGNHITME
jgi:actin-related protein 3